MKRSMRHTVRRAGIAAAVLMPLLWVTQPALSENPEDVQRLQLTEHCMACDLSGSDLSGMHLIGADLRNTNLAGADLSYVNLEGADLTGANLTGANLTGAFLTNASLSYANLTDVNFTQAHLYYVDVTGATLTNLNLAEAEILETPISVGGEFDSLPSELIPGAPSERPLYDPPTGLQPPPNAPPADDIIEVPPQTAPAVR